MLQNYRRMGFCITAEWVCVESDSELLVMFVTVHGEDSLVIYLKRNKLLKSERGERA